MHGHAGARGPQQDLGLEVVARAARAERERRRDRIDAEAGLRVRQRLTGDAAHQPVRDPVAEARERA